MNQPYNQPKERVITYVPQPEEEELAHEMGTLRRGMWLYTHRLGLNYSLVLLLSLGYQALVALFIGVRAIRNLPLITWLPQDVPFQVLALLVSMLAGVFIQGLMIAEAAQIVWLRRTDRLKTRLEQDSYWWAVIVAVLGILIILDFLLLFMAVTGTSDLARAWEQARLDQLTFFSDAIMVVLNLLTLLRCASVMRTSTSELNRREVEERLKAIADEILLDAGDVTRQEAQKVWKHLATDPRKFLPLQKAVLDKIQKQHPNFFPTLLGGDTWAYDFNGNCFAALPPNLHQALLAGRATPNRFSDREIAHLWGMPPEDLAQMVGFNLETYGDPRFINALNPTEPEFAFSPVDFRRAFGNNTGAGNSISLNNATFPLASPRLGTLSEEHFSDRESFLAALSQQPAMKLRFAKFLIDSNAASQKLNGAPFIAGQGVEIFELFDLIELQFYYRQFDQG